MGKVLVLLAAVVGCAKSPAYPELKPSLPTGADPAIGRRFGVSLPSETGEPTWLSGAEGRVMLVCVEGPDAQSLPSPAPSCGELAQRWGDRLAAIAIVTAETLTPSDQTVRRFHDPSAKKLREQQRLSPNPPFWVVVDRRGRVAEVITQERAAEADSVVAIWAAR